MPSVKAREVNESKVLFNIEPQSPCTGSIWGANYTYEKQINLKVFSDNSINSQLAKLVGSGLALRNVDAAGRGLALHNNLLLDAVFDRQPLRHFEELLVAEEVVEEAPMQPLRLKAEELSDGEATAYVEGAVGDVEVADVDVNGDEVVSNEIESEAVVIEFDGVS